MKWSEKPRKRVKTGWWLHRSLNYDCRAEMKDNSGEGRGRQKSHKTNKQEGTRHLLVFSVNLANIHGGRSMCPTFCQGLEKQTNRADIVSVLMETSGNLVEDILAAE